MIRRVFVLIAVCVWPGLLCSEIRELTPVGFADEVREVKIAPDQQHVAFLTSGGGGEALWWAPIDGNSDPVLLSGASTNLTEFAIAPGSDRVAFTAFDSGLLELWVSQVAAPNPVRVSTPSENGRAESPAFDADGGRVLYREGPNGGVRRLWSAPADGNGSAVPISGEHDNCGRFEMAAGGQKVIFHVFQPAFGRSELFVAPTDGSTAAEVLSLFPGDPEDPNDEELTAITDWMLTPDRSAVIYIAQREWPDDPDNLAVDLELYQVAAVGPSGSELRLDLHEPETQKEFNDRTDSFVLSPDGATVVFRYSRSAELPDDRVVDSLFAVPLNRSTEPVEVATVSDNVFSFTATGGHAVYLGGDTAIADSLRSAPFDGGGFVTLDGDPVSPRMIGDGFIATPDGVGVVYPVGAERALWASAADGAGGPVELTPWLGFNGDVQPDFEVTPGSSSVLYRSDLELSSTYELYASALTGGATVKINDPAMTGRHVFAFEITADEGCVVFASESSSSAPRRLFAADLHGSCAPSASIFADGFESGDVSRWSAATP